MANTIKLKNSGTSSNVPSSLEYGELAINYADGKLFYKDSGGSIVEFTATASPAGSDGQVQYNNGGAFGGASGLHYDDGNARLGIGTTSPGTTLDVAGAILGKSISASTEAVLELKASYAQLQLTDTDDSTFIHYSYSGGALRHRYNSTSANEFFTLDGANQRVGIGATSPNRLLDLNDATNSYLGWSEGGVEAWVAGYEGGSNDRFIIYGGTPGGTKAYRMIILDDGKVGIGTTVPTSKLTVSGDIQVNGSSPEIFLTDTDTNADSKISASSTVGSLIIAADINNEVASTNIVFQSDGVDRMYIKDSGYVGIGTNSPAAMLDVAGDIYFNNNALVVSNASSTNIDHIWHDETNNAWNFVSDSTYKAAGNSALTAGSLNVSTANATTVNATTVNLNTSVHLTNVDADGSMRVQGNNGYIDVGPKNSTYCHIYTDRGSFYFNKETLYANSTDHKIWHRGDLRGGATSVAVSSTGYGTINHGLGATPDFAFVGARTRLSNGNDNQLSFPITSYNSTSITFRAYEINGDGNSNYTSSTIYNATVYVFWMVGNQ